MANILITGGGFAGVVAAERLAKTLGAEHQITLVARTSRFVFYPALVRLAFGKCEPDDVSFDLRGAMLDRRVRFVEATVARVEPRERKVTVTGGDFVGDLKYDYLIYALGRRLATEQVKGFFEHAHHLLSVESALKFSDAVMNFRVGRAVVGSCPRSPPGGPGFQHPVGRVGAQVQRRRDELPCGAGRRRLVPRLAPGSPGLRDRVRTRAPVRGVRQARARHRRQPRLPRRATGRRSPRAPRPPRAQRTRHRDRLAPQIR